LKKAVWAVPSVRVTVNWRQVVAQLAVVAQAKV